MTSIPPALRAQLASDVFMERSCLSQKTPVQWHHALIYKGRKVQSRFCILPLTREEHRNANRPDIKRRLEEVMLERATEEEMVEYSWFFRTLVKKRLKRVTEGK